ncbi:MAG: phosphoglucosamine mutase [Bacteroidales bacterium]|nr:phosphoglucosamine mutase [Bacteroidales bacterium]MBN2632375.1 phosphoglucosamine mutase [Bacteroidales bacterium]
MALIKSISGIRGTIGGFPGESLSPPDIVKFASAYATWLKRKSMHGLSVILGRDARVSGALVSRLVADTFTAMGIDVTDLGFATTPTVELAVTGTGASGGVIVTASHNPAEWNALKLLDENGEFLSAADGEYVLRLAASERFEFVSHDKWGSYKTDDTWNSKHIDLILAMDLVETKTISLAGLTVAVDCINSVGALIVPDLLRTLGVEKVVGINMRADGRFAHNPEPLPEHLQEISETVRSEKAHLGFVVDPDVDRLAVICEDGSMFGEEYTLVAVADYVLSHTPGNTVSNMSSTRALEDVTLKHGGKYYSSPVGEVNVVEEMKRRQAVIGGEGNGGVIYPELHYGRDALAGIALFLTHLAKSGLKCSELRRQYPDYVMSKNKLKLSPGADFDLILQEAEKEFSMYKIDRRDGMRIDFEGGWIQIRKSNTEPVIRIYSEARTFQEADKYVDRIRKIVKKH